MRWHKRAEIVCAVALISAMFAVFVYVPPWTEGERRALLAQRAQLERPRIGDVVRVTATGVEGVIVDVSYHKTIDVRIDNGAGAQPRYSITTFVVGELETLESAASRAVE